MKEETKQQLKDLGLQSIENISEEVIEDVFKLIEIIIKDTDNTIDDALLIFLPKIKEYVLQKVDEIKK